MIEGGVEKAGRQLFECAMRAGFGANSHVHAVGDGAPWIVGQVEEQFGAQGSYLIDFYHEALAKLRARPEFLRFLVIFECPRPAGGRFPIC
jgi:hypothetical protein